MGKELKPMGPIEPEVLSDLLSLADIVVTAEECAARTPEERQQAERWASAMVLAASDNPDVRIPTRPAWLPANETDKRLNMSSSSELLWHRG